jgi:Glycosyltransferase family 92
MSEIRSLVKRNRLLRTPLFMVQDAYEGFCSTLLQPASRPDVASSVHYLAAVVRVKDEARFLPEWIAHHLNLGIEHFYIYDNGSTDGTREVIYPFIERGIVTFVDWPIVPASPACYWDFLKRYRSSSKWVAFFDADEFLFEKTPGETMRVLRSSERRPAVAINWRYFGSAGYEAIPTGLVTERFVLADTSGDAHVKVIAQPTEIFRYRNSHSFYYRHGRLGVTPDGRRVYGSFATPRDDPILVLHHYVYRSRQDYERKLRQGFVDKGEAKERARHSTRVQTEFPRHNEVTVGMSRETLHATAEVLRELGFPPGLYVAP